MAGKEVTSLPLDVQTLVKPVRERVLRHLETVLPGEDVPPSVLHQAMRYSVFAGGKRLRAVLVVAGAHACSEFSLEEPPACVLDGAAAVEMIHTYSLIHDDLPCMDDDDLRRGKPTNHIVYGEANALLAGDGLLTLAFHVLAYFQGNNLDEAGRRLGAVRVLADGAGCRGMVGGQVADLEAEHSQGTLNQLNFIHENKTARLISASVEMGGILGGGRPDQTRALARYGMEIGLAFQTVDDILDVYGDEGLLGKPVGSDLRHDKLTTVRLLGLEGARRKAQEHLAAAEGVLEPFGARGDILRAIARYIVTRET